MIGYCTIDEAAKATGYSTDKLISFGANEVISIGLVVGKGVTIFQRIDKTGAVIEEKAGGFPGHTVKIAQTCLQSAEAGVNSAEIILGSWPGEDGQSIEILKIMDLDTGKPLLVKDARLIVYDADLAILEDSRSKNHPPSTVKASANKKEHGITTWLRETWHELGCPGGTKFFSLLKRYADKEGSPIKQHHNEGIELDCSPVSLSKKAILNKVSEFKKTMSSGTS